MRGERSRLHADSAGIPVVVCIGMLACVVARGTAAAQPNEFIVSRSFIYERAPFPSAHASTIEEMSDGTIVAAWFGGSDEGEDDVEIWVSRKPPGGAWSAPAAATTFPDMPTWNPVLFRDAGKLWLFFKVGPSPREWTGAYRTSTDGGRSWGPIEYLPAGLLGPIRAKPIRLADGTLLAGTSVESGYRSGTPSDAPYRSWASWVERSRDGGRTWTKHGPITVPGYPYGVIQPTLWQTDGGEVRMFMRSARLGRVATSSSQDGGRTWSTGRATELPNPNSGLDAVRLRDGRILLVYNHTTRGRSPIHLAVSHDDGTTWDDPVILEGGEGEYSYPAVIQASDGMVHVTYTWRRQRIRHVVIDPDRIPHRRTEP